VVKTGKSASAENEDFGFTFEAIVPAVRQRMHLLFRNGNPADARPSLFIKDEDVRLSFSMVTTPR
jgi:hypothetical protein